MAKAKSPGTAIVKAKLALPVDIEAQMAAEVAEYQKRLQAPTGNKIAVTQSKTFKMPDGTESEEITGIIVDFTAANFYYTEAFERGNITPPACFAINPIPSELKPSDNAPDKQNETCKGCWANEFKSADKGKGKACQNTRILALITPDADVDSPIYLLKVSPTATALFDGYVGKVSQATGKPIRATLTQFSFSPEKEYATMRFTAVGQCNKDQLVLAYSRLAEAKAIINAEPDYSSYVVEEKAAPKTKALKKPAPKGKK